MASIRPGLLGSSVTVYLAFEQQDKVFVFHCTDVPTGVSHQAATAVN